MAIPTLMLALLAMMGKQVETMVELIEKENEEGIRQLAAASPESLRQRAKDGSSLIQQALYRRKPALARLLVELGAQPDFVDSCALGDFAAVTQALRADNQQAGAFSADGFPVLSLAVFFGHMDVAAFLLRAGADVNTPARNALKVSPIHAAVERGDLSLAALLLSHGAAPDAKEFLGATALHTAAAGGKTALVRLLLGFGADRTARTKTGETPLDLAKKGNHKETTALLE